ncbi:MAG TPA: DUF3857 and transglutaminase domain-containing protein [Candidatus Angelobacter sp.]|nr:DUF3857 and transglutaminase domain-containing protein [Candidatus Angelobacter sp.]
MRNRFSYSQPQPVRAIDFRVVLVFFWSVVGLLFYVPRAAADGEAPAWMKSVAAASIPSYDEKTNAVLLYSETNLTVLSVDRIKTHVRKVYKILRPDGRGYGSAWVYFNAPGQKVENLHGWCIPAQGKDFEVKEKDATDMSPPGVEGGELVDDVKVKSLRIPAADPGNIIGYEYEIEERPLVLEHRWDIQDLVPTRESHFSLQLPAGWEYKASWVNHPEIKAMESGSNRWEWATTEVKGIRQEPRMPPWFGIAGQMVISFLPPGGLSPKSGYTSWETMGAWYRNLLSDRLQSSPQIKEQVANLIAGKSSSLEKMQALAEFIQRKIRYVAIELGIGGWQPHAATDVFTHRYGDCKDKATLMRAMLSDIGIESYHVLINTQRGSVGSETPAHRAFNHAIMAVKLPEGLTDPSLVATMQHPKLGRILFFDPTDTITPFGQIRGHLQFNYGLLVTPDGGELVRLPQESSSMNGTQRTARLTLDATGALKGDVEEVRLGDRASSQRWALRSVTSDKERIKPIENLLAMSLTNFQVIRAAAVDEKRNDQPLRLSYSFASEKYAKSAGTVLLVRPRVLGVEALSFLETKEPRAFPVEFDGPVRDTDSFEITLPDGYQAGELPAPVDMDYSFASYHAKTEVIGRVIRYTRSIEIKELSVPAEKVEELRKFYRVIANDERSTVVVKAPTAQS